MFVYRILALLCLLLMIAFPNAVEAKKHRSDFIVDRLSIIGRETLRLNKTLYKWDGSPFGALAIQKQHNRLVDTIKLSTSEIIHSRDSRLLYISGAIRVKRATKALITTTSDTLETLIAMDYRFKDILMLKKVRDNLNEIREVSTQMNNAILPKLPIIARPIARHVIWTLDQLFVHAVQIYDSRHGDGGND
ncbi:hypothetical protein M406DRAFT_71767 [Cryphonectria parasitica EP155]|uniref:Uncharacterized protein n=1 Tax=Cryphonectria parasitica (strain ATCC 38755 / EP155) TaxID=660469 RepID=A0A9P5CSW6_CRYP1|nr:uncharacterized protein M406DRAFT_71767 [Cryphonectria parasitica EP155]KAF3768786.1 hypothetical protein M406DRAFT_71767 [Cryphonectria parasitica EP155]